MEKRVEMGWLLDFYGPLLTRNREKMVRLYCEEDLSLSEIAEMNGITRQGAHDAIRHAFAQLTKYEEMLGLLARYRRVQAGIEECRRQLAAVSPAEGSAEPLLRARRALDEIEWNER